MSNSGSAADVFEISVIVPTFNRAVSLQRLLTSLNALAVSDSFQTEIVVVDNGSTDDTSAILARQANKCGCFRLITLREERKGKSSALNSAIGTARGEILIVVDDDVVVHPEWVSKHLKCHRETGFGAIQGRVLPGVDPDGRPADPKRLREYNIPIIDYGDDIREIRGLTGTNMSFKREVFRKVGLFDPRLGPGAAGFSEDTEYSRRIRQAGFKIGYTPHAVVYHELNPVRYGRAYNRDVEYRKGVSRSIYRRDSILFRVIPDLLANCLRYSIYKILGLTQKAYKTEGRIMKCWGYLAGRARRLHAGKLGLEK